VNDHNNNHHVIEGVIEMSENAEPTPNGPAHDLTDLLDNDECAEILGLSRNKATAIMKEVGAFNIGVASSREWRIWRQDLLAWIEKKSRR
jgi:hypothetical protein